MTYHRRKVDGNQREIVAGLRAIGACVIDLSGVGAGVMDLLVIYRRRTHMVELKNLDGRGNKLTPAQIGLHQQIGDAGGEVHIVTDLEQAIALVTRTEVYWHE